MAALPYIQLYVADYLADTAHLTAAQHGAYLLLIFNYWQRGKPLNNFNERLTNVARMSSDEWEKNKSVLQEFFIVDGDEWTHARIEADLAAVLMKSTKSSNAGKASAKAKLNRRSTNVEQTLNHTDTDTDTDKTTLPNGSVCGLPEQPTQEAIKGLPVPTKPDCPHKEIIALYHEILPACPSIRDWTPSRATALRTRWSEKTKHQNLEYWRGLFEYIASIPFLIGQKTGRDGRVFFASLDWIVKAENFAKIREGRYQEQAA